MEESTSIKPVAYTYGGFIGNLFYSSARINLRFN